MRASIKSLTSALAIALGITLAPVTGDQPDSGGTVASAELQGDAYVVALATYNVKCGPCAPGGIRRAHQAASKIQDTGTRVAALQEVGPRQYKVLRNRLPKYRFWPRRRFGGKDSAIQLAYDRREYGLRKKGSFRVPVRGYWRIVPWVWLKDRDTGRKFFVMGIHNSPNGRERERDRATAIQINQINRLWRKGNQKAPVFVMGDANERKEFCSKVKRNTKLWSANGTQGNGCPVPPGGPDWLMGNRGGIVYPYYRHIGMRSDHDMIVTRARVRPSSHWYWS
ncbi:hypothetical protein KUV85_08970 [Nocardioides panacisoli]|uniref:hypothetical protein n=1 Tax=Nocardioides panacisoli TaxID=627624 RepID=UPI001C636423|nr:hypothetical protein [Nocardioides panacisoli]QYJ02471.1 hypothetical protein KUV85_08970 [Nocardioides panacisoli]